MPLCRHAPIKFMAVEPNPDVSLFCSHRACILCQSSALLVTCLKTAQHSKLSQVHGTFIFLYSLYRRQNSCSAVLKYVEQFL